MNDVARSDGPRGKPIAASEYAAVAVLIAVLLVLAYQLRFVQDDAFIAIRYAENLANGIGLAWEPGHFVQGYSNFLWVVIIAGAIALGLEPVAASMALGLMLCAVTLACTWALARRVLASARLALGALIVAGGNFSVLAFATGGLEASLQTALVVAAALVASAIGTAQRRLPALLLLLSILLGLAGLTRLDSIIFIAVFAVLALVAIRERYGFTCAALLPALSLAAPGTLMLLLYFAWSYATYGELLPNTFTAKVGQVSFLRLFAGATYVASFAIVYGFAIAALVVFRTWPSLFRDRFRSALVTAIALWTAYLIYIGGDFIGYRMWVVCVPFIAVVLVDRLNAAGYFPERRKTAGIAALSAPFLILSALHGVLSGDSTFPESVASLEARVRAPDSNWIGIGRRLHELFPGGYRSGPTIATTAAGAISYYAKLRSVDMHGLNDEYVAQYVAASSGFPGHTIIAPLGYLIERRVNLVIGHPQVFAGGGDRASNFCFTDFKLTDSAAAVARWAERGAAAPILGMALPGGFVVAMVYLAPHPAIEAQIKAGHLTRLSDDLASEC